MPKPKLPRLDLEKLRRRTGESLEDVVEKVKNPPIFMHHMEGVQRHEQMVALFLLPFVIIFSFGLMLSMHLVLSAVLLNDGTDHDSLGGQSDILQFIVTALTLGMLILSAWFWFMWVRTGAFRMIRLEDPKQVKTKPPRTASRRIRP